MRWRDQTGSTRAAPSEGTRARGGKGKDRRPVIGVLIDTVRGGYQNTVLTAQQEVENGLSAFYTELQALSSLTTAAASASSTSR